MTQRKIKTKTGQSKGFTLTEAMVAAVTTTVVASGAAMGMRGLNSAIKESGDLSGLRSNALTGTRLLRSEVQRSLHLMVQGGSHADQREYTDLDNPDHPEYKTAVDACMGEPTARADLRQAHGSPVPADGCER